MIDDFLFADESVEDEVNSNVGCWKVIIVDDEPEVHAVTKLALSDFAFQNRSLEFYSAYSGEEGRKLVDEHPDAAIILLDVVMETDDAGLKVAHYIREVAKNNSVRIILRTGQPGQAPERQVIVDYDINDYKSKTELTAQKLFTVVMSSLRAYRDIMALETNRQGLQKIIEASADIFSSHSIDQFIEGVMQQLTSIVGCATKEALYASDSLMMNIDSSSAESLSNDSEIKVVAAQGQFEKALGKPVLDIIDDDLKEAFSEAIKSKSIVYRDDHLVAYCYSRFSNNALLYVSGLPKEVEQTDKSLIEMFAQNVQIAYENVQLQIDLEETQQELVYRLGNAVEQRTDETGNHAQRVSAISYLLAQKLGLSVTDSELIKSASPLNDVGNICVPDEILNKPGELTDAEWDVIKTHPVCGHKMLSGSKRKIIRAASIIAHEHHENWDGSGYPMGKAGKDIHIYGRIVSLADVYDVLRHKRAYKKPWSKDDANECIKQESGSKFDPELVQLLLDNIDEVENIIRQYPEVV